MKENIFILGTNNLVDVFPNEAEAIEAVLDEESEDNNYCDVVVSLVGDEYGDAAHNDFGGFHTFCRNINGRDFKISMELD